MTDDTDDGVRATPAMWEVVKARQQAAQGPECDAWNMVAYALTHFGRIPKKLAIIHVTAELEAANDVHSSERRAEYAAQVSAIEEMWRLFPDLHVARAMGSGMERKPRSVAAWSEYTVFAALPRYDLREPTLITVHEEGREFAIRNLRRVPRNEERIRILAYRDWADVLRVVKVMAGDEVLYDASIDADTGA